jgi:putative transposase
MCVGFAVFAQRPTSPEVCAFLNRAIKNARSRPRHIISDRGSQFDCSNYKGWCRWRRIRYRFGAVGQHGSIAIVERFIRSMKAECARRVLVPFGLAAMRTEVACYIAWYNEHRPHSSLGGRTPMEVYRSLPPANEAVRFEPRRHWPRKSRCASPVAPIRGRRDSRLVLVVDHVDGRAHLPVVQLKRAA